MTVKSKLGSVAVAAVALGVGLLLAEGLSRLVLDPADFLQTMPARDPLLGHRIPPGMNGHDALGFRNREVPAQADVVVIGDSMTYGFGVPRDSAWPQQLGALRGQPVYNMGQGGYGPLQYLQLARTEAKALKPRQLIVGLYFGNDLVDSYHIAHGVAKWHDWRETKSSAPAEEPVVEPVGGAVEPQRRFGAARNWLARNSLVYAMVRATVFQPLAAKEQQEMARKMSLDQRMAWTDPAAPAVRTVFTAEGRLKVQDPAQPNVREGLQITKRALAALKDEADRQGVQLLVVLIPTRERVYCRYLKSTATSLPPSHLKLCETEDAAKADIVQALSAKGVKHVDALPPLEAQVERHVPIYPPTSDGHPTPLGHRVIADVVHAAVHKQP